MSNQAVDIWIANTATLALDTDCLSQVEHHAADQMARPELRARAKARRTFLRHVLGERLDQSAASIRLGVAKNGKPTTPHDMSFNMSHAGDVSIIATGETELGIDIEPTARTVDLEALLTKTCSRNEQSAIRIHPDPTLAFLDRWVRKEALLKCIGSGLIEDLPNVDPQPSVAWQGMSLYPITLDGPFIAALATKHPVTHLNLRTWQQGKNPMRFANKQPAQSQVSL